MKLRTDPEYFSLRPKIVRSGVETTCTIKPLGGHVWFEDDEKYYLRILPKEQRTMQMNNEAQSSSSLIPMKAENGCLHFTHTFEGEQEHVIQIFWEVDGKLELVCKLSLYSLFEDLYHRRPYKGDTHVHSSYSDGREAPAVVAANYRKAGFDFLAITDHEKYFPSVEAVEAYKDMPTDLKLFYGEEVHIPNGYIHVVNFGGNFSVNDLYRNNKEKCDAEVQQLAESITDENCPDKLEYAYRLWIANKIREGGGFAIYVHPHWVTQSVYCTSDRMSDYIFEQKTYDAFELLNGMEIVENNMQTAYYFEQRAKGHRIPIVGASDSHGTNGGTDFEEEYTIVFSEDCEFDSLCNSIKDFYSVAVEHIHGEHYRVYGEYRFVKYALFLMTEYFKPYQALCHEQGARMLDCHLGDPKALEILKLIEGRTDDFAKDFFGR